MEHLLEPRSLGAFSVAPIGFGAMRLTGPNVFGPPRARREAVQVLREAVARGVNHIDTAQFYGPDIVSGRPALCAVIAGSRPRRPPCPC
jgi:aryl-alcohol dehydrogenase-like predicted oxidoreductase